ncbi:uncharacterized protein LOC123532243 isoform X2 [Mercenaria mercenaria]|nr:uncharacterized protein LOC123532243 isoform X2 [Mercenaria mercenaria]XP_045169579.2 uncharacterized protein LOC123532243 isoform X2 [Mercenaria mercenaria]XP_045169587.2 uncharacterized protein LOC123532243 isoform X2 [Mercenaria mercenaria]
MDSTSKLLTHLEEHAKPNKNDLRHRTYVDYVNCFLSHFGKERAYLVGSTCEKMKLRWSYQGGDADFLFCSGILEIPVVCIEPRPHLPSYVWVRADKFDPAVCGNLVLGKYLPASIVKEVRPELFTILRAIYNNVTMTSDGIPGRRSRVTIVGTKSKVGLQISQYRNLAAEGLPESKGFRRIVSNRSAQVTAQLRRRWSGVEIHPSDTKMLQRIFKLFAMFKVPGSKGENFGKLNKFAQLLSEVLKRPSLDQCDEQGLAEDAVEFNNDLDEDEEKDTDKLKASFTEKTTKDFVPALRIIGERKLECMNTWKKRVELSGWPGKELADDIYNTDIFLVARDAPTDPDVLNRDFCLSFNLAEMKISQHLSEVQRRVFLILKSYLKGFLEMVHKEMDTKMKLKTYHLKTAFFWVCEQENATAWTEGNEFTAVDKCLTFLLECMAERKLRHYFVDSNLLVNFTELDFDILKNGLHEISLNKAKYVHVFFEEDKKNAGVEWITEDEFRSIEQMKEDGGRMQYMDKLEDQLIDLQRGFNASQRDRYGQAPIKEAVLNVIDHFFEVEREKKRKRQEEEKQKETTEKLDKRFSSGPTNKNSKKAAKFVSTLLTGSGSGAVCSQQLTQTADLLIGLATMFPGGSEIVDGLGGQEGVKAVLKRTVEPMLDYVAELRSKIDRYLSCTDADIEVLAEELKHELTAFTIRAKGKCFFDD